MTETTFQRAVPLDRPAPTSRRVRRWLEVADTVVCYLRVLLWTGSLAVLIFSALASYQQLHTARANDRPVSVRINPYWQHRPVTAPLLFYPKP